MTIFSKLPLLTVLAFASQAAISAEIGGTVKDERGQALAGVNLCLLPPTALPDSNENCLQQQLTDASGQFRFTVPEPGQYRVTVRDGRQATYVFNPVAPTAVIRDVSTTVAGLTLQRQFNFSNFQQELTISSDFLPELFTLDLGAEPAYLKLYLLDPSAPAGQKLLFIGEVSDPNNLAVKLSLPWGTKAVQYEIYNSTQTLRGAIPLSG